MAISARHWHGQGPLLNCIRLEESRLTFAAWLTLGLFVISYLGMTAGGVRRLRIVRGWIAGRAAVLLCVSGALSVEGAAHHLDPGAFLLALFVTALARELSALLIAVLVIGRYVALVLHERTCPVG